MPRLLPAGQLLRGEDARCLQQPARAMSPAGLETISDLAVSASSARATLSAPIVASAATSTAASTENGAVKAGSRSNTSRSVAGSRGAINGLVHEPAAPFGGFKESGIGREYGAYGIEDHLELKAIAGG